MAESTEIYGRGFAFPFAFDAKTGGVLGRKGPSLVEDDLIFLLGTYPRELMMAPTFGSRINETLFDLIGPEQVAYLKTVLLDAVTKEPRIERVTAIDVEQDPSNPNALTITLSYRLISQTDDRNLVIPLLRG